MVPVWVRVLVFLGVATLLYLIYSAVGDSLENPLTALLDNLSQGVELSDEPPALPEPEDAPAPFLTEED
ncbi:hypothetical protein JZ751_023380 [Albula glossodonta]|nr:hypothetical protein JZ751_023380 [Albula glossodonta]